MIEKGTRLKLIKPIEDLKKVGEEFIVTEVSDNAIYLSTGFGKGCISKDGWNLYFKKIIDDKKNWGKWDKCNAVLCFDEKSIEFPIKVRFNDYGVQVKYKNIKAKACVENPEDFWYNELFEKACLKLLKKYVKAHDAYVFKLDTTEHV